MKQAISLQTQHHSPAPGRLQATVLLCVAMLASCATPPPPPKPIGMHDQVLDLIKRVMVAHHSGLLENQEAAMKQLNLSRETFTDAFGIKGERILTGIDLLDGKIEIPGFGGPPTVFYRARSRQIDDMPSYAFRLGALGAYVCIREYEIETLYGKPNGSRLPNHRTKTSHDTMWYSQTNGVREMRAAFDYRIDERGHICLVSFTARQPPD